MAVLVILVVAAAVIFASRWHGCGKEGLNQQNDVISVSGSASLEVKPDQATVWLSVNTVENTAAAAQSRNSDLTNAVVAALKNAGVKDNDIKTTQLYLNKKEHYDDVTGKMVFDGYELVHTIKVVTDQVEDVGKLVDAAINAGANGINNVDFELKDASKKQFEAQMLADAVSSAKNKAEALASSAGVKLGKATSISESGIYTPYNNYYGGMMEKSAVAAAPIQISPGNVKLETTVSVQYEIK